MSAPGQPVATDDELMERCAAGDSHAFAMLIRRHQAAVLRCACKALQGDLAAAQDVAQQTFIDLHRHVPRYQARGKLRALLYTMLINRIRMATRGRKLDLVDTAHLRHAASNQPRQDDELIRIQRHEEVAAALLHLSDKLSDALLLRYAADCSHQEIAEILGIPVGTVKSRIAAALEELRKHIPRGSA